MERQAEKSFFVAVLCYLRLDIEEGADLRYGRVVFEDFYQSFLLYDNDPVCSVRRVGEQHRAVAKRGEVEIREGGFG